MVFRSCCEATLGSVGGKYPKKLFYFSFVLKTQLVLVTLSKLLHHYEVRKHLIKHKADYNVCFLLQKTHNGMHRLMQFSIFFSIKRVATEHRCQVRQILECDCDFF